MRKMTYFCGQIWQFCVTSGIATWPQKCVSFDIEIQIQTELQGTNRICAFVLHLFRLSSLRILEAERSLSWRFVAKDTQQTSLLFYIL